MRSLPSCRCREHNRAADFAANKHRTNVVRQPQIDPEILRRVLISRSNHPANMAAVQVGLSNPQIGAHDSGGLFVLRQYANPSRLRMSPGIELRPYFRQFGTISCRSTSGIINAPPHGDPLGGVQL
jgi:hypothetical protein